MSKGLCIGMEEVVACILKVRLHNIRQVVERRVRMAESRELEFVFQKKRKQIDVLDSATVTAIELWWYRKIRVSPSWKDIAKKFKY